MKCVSAHFLALMPEIYDWREDWVLGWAPLKSVSANFLSAGARDLCLQGIPGARLCPRGWTILPATISLTLFGNLWGKFSFNRDLIPFYLWWMETALKLCKISKHEQDCSFKNLANSIRIPPDIKNCRNEYHLVITELNTEVEVEFFSNCHLNNRRKLLING